MERKDEKGMNRVRYLGNLRVSGALPDEVSLDQLRSKYTAVILATGSFNFWLFQYDHYLIVNLIILF